MLSKGVATPSLDKEWCAGLQQSNRERQLKLRETCNTQAPDENGAMHPYRLLGAVNEIIEPDSIVVVDGGDIASFARVALKTPAYLDSGTFGCLGVGMPFAVAAALAHPNRRVVLVTGDGAFGFNALELETAVRTGAKIVVVVANNGAWNIERVDQVVNFEGNIIGTDIAGCRYDLVARGLGAYGEHVERVEDLPAALERAVANAPALLDVRVTRDAISPDFKSGLAEIPDFQPLRSWNDAEEALAGDR